VTVRRRRRIFDDFFKIDEAQVAFERYDGAMAGPARRLVFERGDSVAAVVFLTDTRRVLLAEQFRYPTWDKGPGWVVELVAGMIDGNEKPAVAMRRELEEEIGYRATRLRHIATFYVSPGGSSERVWLYAAEVDASARLGAGGGLASEHEDIRLVSWTLTQAADAVARRKVVDGKTLIGLQWLLAREAGGTTPTRRRRARR
jgi:ADP-ribose pyrophosphatase